MSLFTWLYQYLFGPRVVLSVRGATVHYHRGRIMSVSFADDEEADFTATFFNRRNKPIPAPGPITWATTDPAVASVSGTDATVPVLGVGTGTTTLTMSCRSLTATADLVVTPSPAVRAELTAGAPRPQP